MDYPNRRLKFRIWFEKEKKWIHGPHYCEKHGPTCHELDGVNLLGETILFGGLLDGVSISDLNEVYAVQFTGLFDQSGTQIYEGDIIQNQAGRKFIVAYNRKGFEYQEILSDPIRCSDYLCNSVGQEELCQVIGNIFENKELYVQQCPTPKAA